MLNYTSFENMVVSTPELDIQSGVLFSSSSIILTPIQKEIIVGNILGDASLERRKPSHNTRIRFDQTYPAHEDYVLHLYDIFYNLVSNPPRIHSRNPDKRTGKIYSTIAFKSRNLDCLNYYHDIFYKNSVKIVPSNIEQLLTPRGLAYWIMDDGHKTHYNQTVLNTDTYVQFEVKLLQKALYNNFKLNTRIELKKENQWRIYIPVRQEIPLSKLVGEYMHPTLSYKI